MSLRPLLPLLLLGCAPPEPTPLDALVDAWLADQQLAPASCGAAGTCATGDASLPAGPSNCLAEAWTTCSPAQISWISTTIEGDPVYTVLVVSPGEEACEVTRWLDTREDAFAGSGGRVTRSTCAGLVRDSAGCPGVEATRCEDPVVVP